MSEELRLRDIGEQGLLQRVQRFCPSEMVGDDAALLSVAEGYSLVVTTDLLVDGVHFSDRTTTPFDAGWRSAAANLSDLAAMGASPIALTVGLALPGDISVSWVEQLYQGITQCLQPHHAAIAGGDICRSKVTTISITALGQVRRDRAILRSVARPGDAIVVTGIHGASRAGLELLLHPEQGKVLSERDRASLIQSHQRPTPRLDILSVLNSSMPNAPSPIAGMDSSDGLADAILQICRASHTGAEIDRAQIPVPSGITAWVGEDQAIEWALYGGEDFELVLTLPLEWAQSLVTQIPGAAIIGTITDRSEVVLVDRTGNHSPQTLSLHQGFQHF